MMFQKIQQIYSLGKSKLKQGILFLISLFLLGAQKVLGQKLYVRLEGVYQQAIAYYQGKRDQVQAYYDARVDKNSAYYKPIVRIWRIAGKTVLYSLVYLFVIETNIFWLTGQMPSVDDLQNPKLSDRKSVV